MIYFFAELGANKKRKENVYLPRISRRKSCTQTYHIMLRGINKEDIFLDTFDNMKFLKILKITKDKYNFELYGYCLMKNHIHLIINHKEISLIMKSIAVSYANYFNKKYNRVGHLFQDRFRSRAIENKEYMKNVLRYVHQNPVKAGICDIHKYKWSSYNEYIKELDENLIDKELGLRLFEDSQNNAINNFEKFMSYNNFNNTWKDEIEFELVEKITDEHLEDIIKEILKIDDIREILNYNKIERNNAIKKLGVINQVSYSQIARVIGVNLKVIQRVLNKM